MVRIRCSKIPLLVMGTFVFSTPLLFPATTGKALEHSSSAPPLVQVANTSQSSSQVQLAWQLHSQLNVPMPEIGKNNQQSYQTLSQPSQVANYQEASLTQTLSQMNTGLENAQEPPALQEPSAVQTPMTAQAPPATQSEDNQSTTQTQQSQQQTDVVTNQDTSVETSGPLSASIAWGDGTTSTTASSNDGAADLSALLTIGDTTDVSASGYWMKLDWGDGQTVTEVLGKNALHKPFHVSGTHIYHHSGTFPIHLTVSDDKGNQMTATRNVVVHSVVTP